MSRYTDKALELLGSGARYIPMGTDTGYYVIKLDGKAYADEDTYQLRLKIEKHLEEIEKKLERYF